MRGDAHRQAAENLEIGIQTLQGQPSQVRLIIEAAWLASFHWIAYGCDRKYQKHLEKHQGLANYLDTLGESVIANIWRTCERVRQGGAYGQQVAPLNEQQALDLLNQIRTWATT
jgi:hypothetical protein